MKDIIYQLESSLLKPETRRSAEQLNQLIADDFVEFGSSGRIYTKNDMIHFLPVEAGSSENFEVENFKVIELSPNCMLATYKVVKPKMSLRSSIWKRIGDEWRMIFHQGTRCMENEAK